mmetsp:Transcript_26408/g.66866  ORF Transcript_26408/g.66866 Transcript_26408/m.66866 type:complete len:240 (-) Transcript_26408:415-1134(-)
MEVRKDTRRSHRLRVGLLCAIEDALREEVCEILALLSGDLRRRREGLQVLVDALEEEPELLEVHTRLVVNQRLVELCSDDILLLVRCPVADLLVRQRERLSEGQLLEPEGICDDLRETGLPDVVLPPGDLNGLPQVVGIVLELREFVRRAGEEFAQLWQIQLAVAIEVGRLKELRREGLRAVVAHNRGVAQREDGASAAAHAQVLVGDDALDWQLQALHVQFGDAFVPLDKGGLKLSRQ